MGDGGEGERVLDDVFGMHLGNGTIMLRKVNFAKVAKILRLLPKAFENKLGQVVEKPSDLILSLFSFVKATN